MPAQAKNISYIALQQEATRLKNYAIPHNDQQWRTMLANKEDEGVKIINMKQ